MALPRPRPQPHPLTLFSLIPDGDRARAVAMHSNNFHLTSFIPGVRDSQDPKELAFGINIGIHIGSRSPQTLATLGRNGDITVEGQDISKIQCSFEMNPDTQTIMLYDRSTSRSTQTYGDNAIYFEVQRVPRRLVVDEQLNDAFKIGCFSREPVSFRIHWHKSAFELALDIEQRINHRADNPSYARTEEEAATVQPFKRVTRIHALAEKGLKIRYKKNKQLGSGSFGVVYKAVDVDSGEAIAVKLVKWPNLGCQVRQYTLLKREVETLRRISHVSYIVYLGLYEPELIVSSQTL